MNLKEYLSDINNFMPQRAMYKAIVFKNGHKVSIQRSDFSYCDMRDKWTQQSGYRGIIDFQGQREFLVNSMRTKDESLITVEMGFPSHVTPEMLELTEDYIEDYDNPTGTVYAYVPLHVAQKFIDLLE